MVGSRQAKIKIAPVVGFDFKTGEGKSGNRPGEGTAKIIGLVKTNGDKRIGDGLAGGRRDGILLRRVETEGGRKDNGANIGVVVDGGRIGNADGGGETTAVIGGNQTKVLVGFRKKNAAKFKKAVILAISLRIDFGVFQFNFSVGGAIAVESDIVGVDGGGEGDGRTGLKLKGEGGNHIIG